MASGSTKLTTDGGISARGKEPRCSTSFEVPDGLRCRLFESPELPSSSVADEKSFKKDLCSGFFG